MRERARSRRRGGRAHREQIRDRLSALAARIPAGQGMQIIVEADPLDADRALQSDWRDVSAAAAAARARGDVELAEAMRRLGYGLEQTVRRSAPALDAARLRWTIATRWSPTAAPARGGRGCARARARR